MTLTITLDLTPEEEARLAKKAARAGVDIANYVKRMAVKTASPPIHQDKSKPKTGAELVAYLTAAGVIGAGYGDPEIDSPEMAKQIRREVWRITDPKPA